MQVRFHYVHLKESEVDGMITMFNRKPLIKDTNSEYVASIWSKLRENSIPYEVATKTGSSSFKRMLSQQKNMSFNMGGVPASWMNNPGNYVYIVYVNRKDLERAKKICEL